MAGVSELRIRADWAFVRFAYLPMLAGSVAATKWLWPAVAIGVRVAPCGVCLLLSRWGHHFEEWFNRKPLLQITASGLRHEDGGRPLELAWSDILGIALHRRNYIPPWRTNGSAEFSPRYWLSISVRGAPKPSTTSGGYVNRKQYSAVSTTESDESSEGDNEVATICIWPRQVVGGLFSLVRFARELQSHLILVSDRGEIPSLLPSKGKTS